MSNLATLESLLDMAIKAGATAADAIYIDSRNITTSVRNKNPEQIESSEQSGIGLRVWVGENISQSSSSDVSHESLQNLAEACVNIARFTPADPFVKLLPGELLANEIKNLELADVARPDTKLLSTMCLEAESAALSHKGIINSEGAEASSSQNVISLAICDGKNLSFFGEYQATHYSLSATAIAGTTEAMERDYSYSSKRFLSALKRPEEIGNEAAKRALARINPIKIPTSSLPVLFDKRVSKNLLGYFLGAVSGANIARGTSFLKNSMDEQVFAKGINIIDDPHIKRALGSKPFDAEGAKGSKLSLVEAGVLKSWMLDQRSAAKLGFQTTGHASRSLSSTPHPQSTNAYIAAGKKSFAEIVSSISKGIYVCEAFGNGANLVSGDYSQGAAGFYIENGEITYPISEITIAGNLREMFKEAIAADDLEFEYLANSPSLLIPQMTIAGT